MNPNWVITPKKILSHDEVIKLRRVTEDASFIAERRGQMLGIRDWMLLNLAMQTGLRVSELANLKNEDLYLKNGQSSLIVTHGKCGKVRTVRLTPQVRCHLKKYLN